jgi:hypothetical protein
MNEIYPLGDKRVIAILEKASKCPGNLTLLAQVIALA